MIFEGCLGKTRVPTNHEDTGSQGGSVMKRVSVAARAERMDIATQSKQKKGRIA